MFGHFCGIDDQQHDNTGERTVDEATEETNKIMQMSEAFDFYLKLLHRLQSRSDAVRSKMVNFLFPQEEILKEVHRCFGAAYVLP